MSNQSVFQLAIIGILLICGYICLFQAVSRRSSRKTSLPLLAGLLLVIYAMVAGPLIYIISSLGSTEMLLFTLLMLMSCGVLFVAVGNLIRHFAAINKGMLALFLIYILAVACITVFSRERSADASVHIFRADLFGKALRTQSLQPLNHILLNVAMFVPLGALLPFVYPAGLNRWVPVMLLAVMTTTLIETLQFFLLLGQADLTDIFANVLGAAIGFGGYRLLCRFRPDEP